jgi:putative ABC transport system permease protein
MSGAAGDDRRDWRDYVRAKLADLDMAAERHAEIVEELAEQLASAYRAALAEGLPEPRARERAEAEVDDWNRLARELERIERPLAGRLPDSLRPSAGAPALPIEGGGPLTGFLRDLRQALRALRRSPGYAAIAVSTLALGIGATALVYSLVDGVLLRPLPIRDPGRVVLLRESQNNVGEMSVSWPDYVDFRAQAASYSAMGAMEPIGVTLTGVERPERLQGRRITAGVLGALGVAPELGRGFLPADDRPGADPVCIVSYRFWHDRLGARAAALRSIVRFDGQPYTLVGVLPRRFAIGRGEDVFLPLGLVLGPGSSLLERQNHQGLSVVARLRPGVTLARARAEAQTIYARIAAENPKTNSGDSARLLGITEAMVGQVRPMLWVLLAAVSGLLAIGCANLANLQLARAAAHEQEAAVRRTLGATRWRLVRQQLTESLVIALAGGALGAGLAYLSLATVLSLLPTQFPRVYDVAIDGRVLVAALAISIASGLAFGAAPALFASSHTDPSLLNGVRVSGRGALRSRTRRLLLLSEVALAVVLLAGAGLMARTMARLARVDPGFRGDHLLTAWLPLDARRYDDDRVRLFFDRAEARLRSIPGVTDAGFAGSLPTEGAGWISVFVVEGRTPPPLSEVPSVTLVPASPSYLPTLGVPVLSGRNISPGDRDGTPRVAVVSEGFARRFFPHASPIGHRFKQGWTLDSPAPWVEIVGVAGDVLTDGLDRPLTPAVYLSNRQFADTTNAVVVRTAGDPARIEAEFRAAIHELDPDLPVVDLRPLDAIAAESLGSKRLTTLLLSGFAALALLLAAIGVFGVTAYTVSRRTHEFGIRMALGADRRQVLVYVLREGAEVAAAGVVLGLAATLALSGLMSSLLFQVPPRDPATLAVASVTVLAISCLACYLPARRATRVDPMTALRVE